MIRPNYSAIVKLFALSDIELPNRLTKRLQFLSFLFAIVI